MPTGHIPILQIKTKDGKWLPVNAIGGQVASKVLYNNAYPTVEQALDYLFKNGTGGSGGGGNAYGNRKILCHGYYRVSYGNEEYKENKRFSEGGAFKHFYGGIALSVILGHRFFRCPDLLRSLYNCSGYKDYDAESNSDNAEGSAPPHFGSADYAVRQLAQYER